MSPVPVFWIVLCGFVGAAIGAFVCITVWLLIHEPHHAPCLVAAPSSAPEPQPPPAHSLSDRYVYDPDSPAISGRCVIRGGHGNTNQC